MDEQLIQKYAKKIFGFAYGKTNDAYLAEDLSQEILLSLFSSLRNPSEIDNMDAFVYTICCYTWSKFLRKNKKTWDWAELDCVSGMAGTQCVEQEVENQEASQRMCREIAYLSKLHRRITVLYYYEELTCDQIAKLLAIPSSTVRWHLTQIRKKLQEGFEMNTEHLNMMPQKLRVGHDGWVNGEYGQCGLGKDRLVDNICLACYGPPLTIEEIARKLSVASAYLEYHIERLVYMDYLKQVGKNKYQTNFFIRRKKQDYAIAKYEFTHIGPMANKLIDAFETRYQNIVAIDFIGSKLDRDFLFWALLPLAVDLLTERGRTELLRRKGVSFQRPKHKDGSEHFVGATLEEPDDENLRASYTQEELAFYEMARGNGIKTRESKALGLESLQLDTKATADAGQWFRDFQERELNELARIAALVVTRETPNEMDQLLIARMVEKKYVTMAEGKPMFQIPFFYKEQFDRFSVILDEILEEVGLETMVEYLEGFGVVYKNEFPDFISKQERDYWCYSEYPHYAILYYLTGKGRLRYPTKEEALRLSTVIWQTK